DGPPFSKEKTMKDHSQTIVFPGNNVESLAEANAMLSAVSEDARKASNTEDKRDLESLQGWLEENINSQLAGVK
ncbi:hypothetical protein P3672_30075, partial [Vibrio parahaemolyticus]|nr:hypothetical protein [Vibrio parahaemolyticus]